MVLTAGPYLKCTYRNPKKMFLKIVVMGKKRFKCNEEDTFNTHFESEHEQKNSESYACKICNFKATSIAKLIYHLKTHSKRKFSIMNTDAITTESQPKSSNDMSCETILVDSELQKTPRSSEKSLQCPKCSFKTSFKHNLDRHINFHNDCSYCGKVFLGSNGKRALATHLKTHQVKPKNQKLCIFCNRDYKKVQNMNRHMKICKKKPVDGKANDYLNAVFKKGH